jgi:hypothetical protein
VKCASRAYYRDADSSADAEADIHDETVQSTSMLKFLSVTLLACASSLAFGQTSAGAVERLYPSAPPAAAHDYQPAPTRVAYAERPRPNMGGGFIEFLFGDEQAEPHYRAQPSYDQRPIYPPAPGTIAPAPMPQQALYHRDGAMEAARPGFDPNTRSNWSSITARSGPAPSWSIRPTSFSIWFSPAAPRCVTASASDVPASPGPV